MNERTGYVKHPSFKEQAKERWEKFKKVATEKTVSICLWVRDNWEIVSVLGAGAATLVGSGVKSYRKHRDIRQQQMLKDRYIYDRRTGHYWHLNRTPSNNQMLELDERRRRGETLGEALRNMRLI